MPRAQQDKNRATFRVICEGRTYNIQAETEAIMKKLENVMNTCVKYMHADATAIYVHHCHLPCL